MNSNISLKKIISYLKSQNIKIDIDEFKYQIETHPEYPSLLSFSDALTFFKVNNMAFKVNPEEIEDLPQDFIAIIKNEGGLQLEHVKNGQELIINKIKISKENFNNQFEKIVLLAEKEVDFDLTSSSKNNIVTYSFLAILFIFFLITFNSIQFSWFNSFLFFSSFIGLLVSVETFKQIIGEKTNIVSKLCNVTEQTSCDSVLTSTKWKIFKYINLSDISILFFINQFTLLFIFGNNQNLNFIYSILFLGIYFSVPIGIISIYYQWKIEKKWCPLCLIIIGVLWLQTYLIYSLFTFTIDFSISNILISLTIIIFLTFAWFMTKNHFLKGKDIQENLKINLRFKRNYNIFKEQILKEEKYCPPINENSILIGNKDAKVLITVFTSPFCGHCKEVHNILHNLIEKYNDRVAVHINFSAVREQYSLKNYLIIKKLQSIFLKEGYNKFHQNIKKIFNKELSKDLFINNFEDTKNEIDLIIKDQNDYFFSNGITFTPLILINGYSLPTIYENKDIEYFFTDLIEDDKW